MNTKKFFPHPFSLSIWHKQSTSVYKNTYTEACHNTTQTQVSFLNTTFSNSNATWKFLQLHHPYASASQNYSELTPLVSIVAKHQGIVLNGHDHCLGHFYVNNTNFILSGAAGYPQAGDCNNGTAQGPFALYLGANNLTGEWNDLYEEPGIIGLMFIAANGFVTLDISKQMLNFEWYARDMKFEGTDLYPVECDLKPSYSLQITQNSI